MRGRRAAVAAALAAVVITSAACDRSVDGTARAAKTQAVPVPTTTTVPHRHLSPAATVKLLGDDVITWWGQNGVSIGPIEYAPVGGIITCAGTPFPNNDALFCRHADGGIGGGGGVLNYQTQAITLLLHKIGEYGVGLVVAHELGHAVQYVEGRRGEGAAWELSADCLAGAYFAAGKNPDRAVAKAFARTQLSALRGSGAALQAGADAVHGGATGPSLITYCLDYHQ